MVSEQPAPGHIKARRVACCWSLLPDTTKTAVRAWQVLCWFSTIGYRITGVDRIEDVDGPDTKELNVHDWADFPSELVFSLKDPMLPPGLLLELSGTWNNPCQSLIPPSDDAHWEPYKNQWCAAKMASYSYNFVPCNIWGEFPAKEVRMRRTEMTSARLAAAASTALAGALPSQSVFAALSFRTPTGKGPWSQMSCCSTIHAWKGGGEGDQESRAGVGASRGGIR